LIIPKVLLKNDNEEGAQELISDVKEKTFEFEDVDPDN